MPWGLHQQSLGQRDEIAVSNDQVVCDPYNYLSSHLVPAQERLTDELLTRLEPRLVVAHLKDVAAGGVEAGTPELGTGVFAQRPYLEFLRDRRPDLDLVVEHVTPDRIPTVLRRVRELVTESAVPSGP